MSERLRPIPTPPSQLWRQLRLQYLPVLIFAIGVGVAVLLWTRWVAPPTLVGEAEAIRTEVRSVQAGKLVELKIELLQAVKAGDILGHVVPSEPELLEASLAVIRAEIEMMRATRDPVIGQQRAAVDLEQLQLDWLGQRVELASLQGQLQQAESTLTRSVALQQSKMIPEEQFELAKISRDTLAAQVKSQAELVNKMEPRLRALVASNESSLSTPAEALSAAIKHKEAELKLIEVQLSPLPLRAPIEGVVTLLHRRSGEAVAAGEPILQISATRAHQIIGFLRQPISMEPKPGMAVEVRTRTFQRRSGETTVASVGQQLEPISPSLLAAMRLPISAIPTEFGIRVHIAAPSGLALRPGEQVDLILRD